MIKSDEFLLKWLNEEVKLDPPVKNIVREFSTGYRFAEILYNLNIITENQFKRFSNTTILYDVKVNCRLLKKYFREKFELEIRKEEFNDIMNKDICKAVIVLYKLKNSISKKNINFLDVKISLDKLTKEEINQKVNEIIDYEYYQLFNKDLLYDLINDEKNNYEKSKFKFSSTIKSSEIFQNNFSLHNTLSFDKIDEKAETKIQNEKENKFPKNFFFNRNKNSKISLNITESKKEISKFQLPSITNSFKSAEILSPNKNIYIKTEQKDLSRSKKSSLFITSDNKKTLYNRKLKFGNGRTNIAEENKFKITKLTDTLFKFGVRDFQSNFKNTLPEFNPSNKKELQKVREELKTRIHFGKSESPKKIKNVKRKLKIRLYDVPEIDFVHKEKNPLYEYKLPIGISLFKHNKYLTFQKRLKYSKQWKIYYNQRLMEKKIKYFSSLIKKASAKVDNENDNYLFDKEIFLSNLNIYNIDNFSKYLYNKKLKLRKDIPLIKSMILLIIDMTMEVFFYREENNAELVDIETFTKLLELFIKNKPMRERVVDKEARIIKERNNESEEINPDKLKLDEEEINLKEDYKNYIGLWNDNIIMNNEFRGMKIDFKKINSIFPSEYEPTENLIQDLNFPNYNICNYLYGDTIIELLDNKYSYKNKNNTKNEIGKWEHINYKISLIGLPFCGKKTIAGEICKNYPNLKIYSIQKLLRNYYEQYKIISEPLESNPKFKSLKPNQIEQMKQEKESKLKEFEPILKIIQPYINSINQNKKEVDEKEKEIDNKTKVIPNDEILLKLVIYNIEKDFPKLSEEEIKKEIINNQTSISNLEKQKENLEKQIKESKKPNPKDDLNLQNIKKDIQNLKNNSVKGFILVDFPTNINQCNLLENYLVGYVDETKKPKSEKMLKIEKINSLIDFNFTPNENNKFKKAGIDFIVNIKSKEDDINKRFENIKYDPLNDKIYTEYELNQDILSKDKKLAERLVDKIPYFTKENFDYCKKEYNENIDKINSFYNMFGFSKNIEIDSNLNMLNVETIEKDIKKTYQEINIDNENSDEDSEINKSIIEEKNENNKNINNNKEINVLIKKEEEKRNKIINFIKDNIIKFLIEQKNENDKKILHSKYPELDNEEEKDKIKFEPEYKINEIRANLTSKKINKEKFYLKYLMDNFDSVLFNLKIFNNKYEKHAGKFIHLIKKQKKNIYIRLNLIQKKYRDFLNQTTDKKEVIYIFCDKYNEFFTEFPGGFNSPQAIEEFSQNIDELNNALWFLINIKETVSIKELQEIKNSNFIEFELKKFFKNIKEIFLLETEKFLTMIDSIINLYQRKHKDESTSTIINLLKHNNEREKEKEKESRMKKSNLIYNKEFILKDLIEISNKNFYEEENEEMENFDIKNNNLKNKNYNIFYKKKNEPNTIDYLINKNTEIIFNNCINLILSQEEKIENLIKSVKEYINTGNKKQKMKKKITQVFPLTSGIIQAKENEIMEENIKKMFENEKNKYKYRICFLRSFVAKYIIIIIHTSMKIFQNIDGWITKSVSLQSDAQNVVIQQIKNALNEKRLIDINKDINSIELDNFEPIINKQNNNNTNAEETLMTPRENNKKIYERLNIDYLINDDFINIKIKEDKDYIQDKEYIEKNIFDIKKYKIIIPDDLKREKENDILKIGINELKNKYSEDDFYYSINKFMEIYKKIKMFEIKKDIISEEILYEMFIKKYLFNKELFEKENNSKNKINLNKTEENKVKENEISYNNDNNNDLINSNINIINNLPSICNAMRNLHTKHINKLFSLFRIEIPHPNNLENLGKNESQNGEELNIQSQISNNNELSEKERSLIEYDNYINNAEIFTFLALIGCKILTEDTKKEMMAILNNKLINKRFLSKEDFYKYKFWFEIDFEYLNINSNYNNNKMKYKRNSVCKSRTVLKKLERKNTKQFTAPSKAEKENNQSEGIKVYNIKELLFNIWKDDKGNNFNFKDFLNTMEIKNDNANISQRYFDFIFNN